MDEESHRIKSDSRPLYVQAVEALETLLRQSYEPDDQLPPEGLLAEQLGISRTTLRVAMGHLERQGLVIRHQGVGTFVSVPPMHHLEGGLQFLTSLQSLAQSSDLQTDVRDRTLTSVHATSEWADRLKLGPDTPLNQLECTIAIEGLPVAYLNSFIPTELIGPQEIRQSQGSLLDVLTERGEPRISYTHSLIYAIEASNVPAKRLEVREGKALLHLVETYFSRPDVPIALSYNYFVTDRFTFYIGRLVRS